MNRDIINIDIIGNEIEERVNAFLSCIDEITDAGELRLNSIRKLVDECNGIMESMGKLENIQIIKQYIETLNENENRENNNLNALKTHSQ